MTARKLERLCRHWIKKLGLEHWEFTVQFVSQERLTDDPGSFYYGKCYPDLDALMASIWLINEKDIPDEMVAALSICPPEREVIIEQTLIHELLHVRLDPSKAMVSDSLFETGLNHTARALWEFGGLTNGNAAECRKKAA